MKLYGAFEKVEPQDDGTIKVWGVASSEAVDGEGEIVMADAMRKALPNYMEFANIREMHGRIAAGTCFEASVGDDGKTRIGAHIVDPVSVKKVQTNVLKGFSIGGGKVVRDKEVKKNIVGLELTEISLVDRPCNPEARIELWKVQEGPPADLVDQFVALSKLVVDSGYSQDQFLAKVKERGETADPKAEHIDTIRKWKAGDKTLHKSACEARAALLIANPKAETLLKSLSLMAGDKLEKGLWTVSSLALLIGNLFDIQCNVACEAAYEGDGSMLPDELKDACKGLGEILGHMVDEEIGELFDEEEAEVIVMAAKIDDLAKRGAKHSKETMAKLKGMHDTLKSMTGGAVCGGDEDKEKAAAALLQKCTDLETKASEVLAKTETMSKTLHETQAALAKLTEERETLKAQITSAGEALEQAAAEIVKLKAEPKSGGPALREGLHVVSKAETTEPEKKEDKKPVVTTIKVAGTPEEVRAAIRKQMATPLPLQIGRSP